MRVATTRHPIPTTVAMSLAPLLIAVFFFAVGAVSLALTALWRGHHAGASARQILTCVKPESAFHVYVTKMAWGVLQFGMERLRSSRGAGVLAAAVFSFLFLFHSDCPTADAAEIPPAVQKTDPDAGGHDHPVQGDTCPSLDHTPVVPPDTALSPVGNAPAKPPLTRAADLGTIAGVGSWGVTPRATPPPIEPLPLYLRYAHLLI